MGQQNYGFIMCLQLSYLNLSDSNGSPFQFNGEKTLFEKLELSLKSL